jgi:hypothetical protein
LGHQARGEAVKRILFGLVLTIISANGTGDDHTTSPETVHPSSDVLAPYKLKSEDTDDIMLSLLEKEIIKRGETKSFSGEMTCSDLVGPDGRPLLTDGRCVMKIGDKKIDLGLAHLSMLPFRILFRFKPVFPFENERERSVVFF